MMVGDALPVEWNGMQLTVTALTEEQEEAYRALPADRAGTLFDGNAFSAIAADPRVAILAELAAIDTATLAAARGIREFILGVPAWAGIAQQAVPALPSVPLTVGLQKIAALEQQAVALRAQLAALG